MGYCEFFRWSAVLVSLLIWKCFLFSLYPRDLHLGILEQSTSVKHTGLRRKQQHCLGGQAGSAHSAVAGRAWSVSRRRRWGGVRGARCLWDSEHVRGRGHVYSATMAKTAPETGWLMNNRHSFLTVLEAGSPRSSCQQIRCLVKIPFLDHTWPSSPCVFTWWQRWGSPWGLFCESTNPIPEGFALLTQNFPKAHLLRPPHWEGGFSIWMEGEGHKQSITKDAGRGGGRCQLWCRSSSLYLILIGV